MVRCRECEVLQSHFSYHQFSASGSSKAARGSSATKLRFDPDARAGDSASQLGLHLRAREPGLGGMLADRYGVSKRVFDLTAATLGLVVLSPVLTAIAVL